MSKEKTLQVVEEPKLIGFNKMFSKVSEVDSGLEETSKNNSAGVVEPTQLQSHTTIKIETQTINRLKETIPKQ